MRVKTSPGPSNPSRILHFPEKSIHEAPKSKGTRELPREFLITSFVTPQVQPALLSLSATIVYRRCDARPQQSSHLPLPGRAEDYEGFPRLPSTPNKNMRHSL